MKYKRYLPVVFLFFFFPSIGQKAGGKTICREYSDYLLTHELTPFARVAGEQITYPPEQASLL